MIDLTQSKINLQQLGIQLRLFQESDWTALAKVASDKRIWEFYTHDYSNHNLLKESLFNSLKEREKGTQYPFTIIRVESGEIIGSTRFLNIDPSNKKLEIGFTWLHPLYWKTKVNLICKNLLLTYCFETMGVNRVSFQTDVTNLRSGKAILKIGATFEGILRKDRLRENGTWRSSAYYSILKEDWSLIKQKQLNILNNS